ncbi:MAG: oligopeptide transporter, OPT family [Planctomycetia bacterium]|nr:oligopeptide transporter, OPT family [Planctomycetia bacterium]
MAAPTASEPRSSKPQAAPAHDPYVPDSSNIPEFTWPAVVVGAILGIIFGASSLYLVLKTGLTVSASIPVAVLSITLFRLFSRMFGIRRATILENNIVQTTGSAGESIAFGVGVTIPAVMLLGTDMEFTRVMTVGALGGLLGILMMIPLRRAFIVKQHGKLKYPEGTACADVLIVGEEGGATAATVFTGFGIAFVHKFLMTAMHLWQENVNQPLFTKANKGLPGGVIGGEMTPELLGVGYIIGPRIASIMVGGGVLAALVLVPLVRYFGDALNQPFPPATDMLIRNMGVKELRNNYILYIGAGAVAAGGIISMLQALPMIFGSLRAGLRDLVPGGKTASAGAAPRTERDLPLAVVVLGSLALVLALAAIPSLGLGVTTQGLVGAGLIVLFGFLFVTVSSRLTGEIGSSSNPISGMTVATLLMTCLIFLAMSKTDRAATLTAMTVAAVVCVAASNGGSTSQDLKTGFLVGATPRWQQIAILIGALTSALVIGGTLLLLNHALTTWSRSPRNLPRYVVPGADKLTQMEKPGGQYAADDHMYHVWHVTEGQVRGIPQGKYLVDDRGQIAYLVDPGINGRLTERDDGSKVTKFDAPKTRLMALIAGGVLQQSLPLELVLIGVLIALVLELAGVPSLPFAVGVYLPIQTSVPIFIGGVIRWCVDKIKRHSAAEADMSPGVLLGSGYIAGGAIAGMCAAFLAFVPYIKSLARFLPPELQASPPDNFRDQLEFMMTFNLPKGWVESNWPSLVAFGFLIALLVLTGLGVFFRGAQPQAPARPAKGR